MKKMLLAFTLLAAPFASQARGGSVMCSDETGKRMVVSSDRTQNGIHMSCTYDTCGFDGFTFAVKTASNGISDTYHMSQGILSSTMTVIFNDDQSVKQVRFKTGSIETSRYGNCR